MIKYKNNTVDTLINVKYFTGSFLQALVYVCSLAATLTLKEVMPYEKILTALEAIRFTINGGCAVCTHPLPYIMLNIIRIQ